MRSSLTMALFVVWLFGQAPEARAQGEVKLTSEDVARRVLAESPVFAARRAQIEAAKAAVTEARLALWPRLVASALYARDSAISAASLGNVALAPAPGPISGGATLVATPLAFPVLPNQFAVQASLSIPVSDYILRFPYTIAAARQAEASVEADRQAAEVETLVDAKSLYYAWARALLQRDVAADSLEQARSHLRLERSRLDAGLSTPANALRVESQEAVAELLLVRLTNLAELLDDQLRTAMRDSSGKSYAIGEDLDAAIKTPIPPLEAAIVQSLEGRAELASTEYARQGEQSQAKAALTLLPPRLELYGALLDANPSPRYFPPQDRFHATWEMGARLTFSPNDAAISVAQARQHRARAAVLGAQRQRLIDGMRTEVVAARQAQEESRTALATTARGLAAAEESYRIRRSLFVEGRATSVELTDAETDLVRARFAAVDARIDLRLARIHLAKALGDRR